MTEIFPAHASRARIRHGLAALLCGTALVHAGAALAQDATTLDTITVQGDGVQGPDSSIVAKASATADKMGTDIKDIPASVTAITQKDLQKRGVTDTMQALAYTSSVSVGEYGSDSRYDWFRIRGFEEDGAGVYLDGLPEPSLGFTGFKMEPYGLQRIDVLKGSTSTLFGMNAPGGLVNGISKRPTDTPFGEVYTTVGTDNHAEAGFDMGGPLDKDGIYSYRVTAKWQDADQGTEYQKDDRRYLGLAFAWKPTNMTSLTLLAKYQQNDGNTGNAIPYGLSLSNDNFYGEPDFDAMNRTLRQIGYEFSHDFGNGLTFRQNARLSSLDQTLQEVYLTSNTGGRGAYQVIGSQRNFDLDNQLQYNATFGGVASRTLAGVSYDSYHLKENGLTGSAGSVDIYDPVYCGRACITLGPWYTSDVTTRATGTYVQEELTVANDWILTLGARKDWVKASPEGSDSVSQDAVTKRAGLTWKATPELSLYANYSESFNPADYSYASYLTDPIKPVRGRQTEVGAKYRPDGTDALFTFALFDLKQMNSVQMNPDYTYSQVGEIGVKGAELEGHWALSDRLNLTFAWSYWDAKIDEGTNAGNRPSLTPKQLASIWADYTIPGSGNIGDITLGGGVRYLGSRYSDDANSQYVPSVALVDLMAGYKLDDNTSLTLNVNNLLDKSYVSSIGFGDPSPSIYYGARRSVLVSLRHTW